MTDDDAPKNSAKAWLQKIKDAEKAFKTYQKKVESIEHLYANLEKMAKNTGDREFKIFWANMEVLKPSIYQRPPQPVVMPRHSDTGEVPRKASQMLERVLEFDVEDDGLHETLLEVRDDLALAARGAVWVLDNGQAIHVSRCDFLHEPARKWSEVNWAARAVYLTKEQGKKAFGKKFKDVELEAISIGDDDYKESQEKAKVWEVWDKEGARVLYVIEGVDEILKEDAPFVDVKGFFPCPRPAYGTLQPGTLLPVPDFVYYRDQVDEINVLTRRIMSLTESLRLKGFYGAGTSEIGEAIEAAMKQTSDKAILVPIANFAALGGGALKDAIVWLPVQEVGALIADLVSLRKQLIEDVYEITGLSDIMRGVTDAQETLGAQNLKAEFGSVRVQQKQAEMVRLALDVLRIKGEIFAETFEIGELLAMAGMQLPTMADVEQMAAQAEQAQQPFQAPVTVEQVAQLLADQRLRPFAMEVETDSTIAPNEQMEKQQRMELLTAVGGFLQQSAAFIESRPEVAPFMGEMLKFGAGAFRAGRDFNGEIDKLVEQLKASAGTGQGEDPAANAEAQAEQARVQMEMQKAQADAQAQAQKLQIDMQKAQADMQTRQAELQLRQQEMGLKREEAQARLQMQRYQSDLQGQLKQQELSIKLQELGIKQDEQRMKERQSEIDALMDAAEIELEATQERPVGIGD